MKRIVTFCLALALIFAPVGSYAASLNPQSTSEIAVASNRLKQYAATPGSDAYPAEAYDQVVAQMKLCAEKIDFTAYSMTAEELEYLMLDITNLEAELFQLENAYWYSYNQSDGKVTELRPNYSVTGSEYESRLAVVRAEADAIMATVDNSWSQTEKALYLHDQIAARYDYDKTLNIYDVYGLVTEGHGVCEAYELWYGYLLGRAGIQSDYCISDQLSHVWNLVCIDGSWYHVDVTWDDPTFVNTQPSNPLGHVTHEYFLRSDAGFSDHPGYMDDRTCNSTLYDNAGWAAVETPIVPLKDKWYAYYDHTIREFNMQTKACGTNILWPSNRDGIYDPSVYGSPATYTGLSAFTSVLLFNNENYIFVLDPVTGDLQIYDVPMYGTDTVLRGTYADSDGMLYYSLLRASSKRYENYSVHISLLTIDPYWLPFTDVKIGKWYYDAVNYAFRNNLFNGVSDTLFAPDKAMNRAMLVSVLYRMEGSPDVSGVSNTFQDVAAGKYYTDAVLWASSNDIVNGTNPGVFSPTHDITREQMATILYRYTQKKGYLTDQSADLFLFPDGSDTSNYASEALSWANSVELITGSKAGDQVLLKPKGTATRAQVATILMRYQALDLVMAELDEPDQE